jgi:hypothetical protein
MTALFCKLTNRYLIITLPLFCLARHTEPRGLAGIILALYPGNSVPKNHPRNRYNDRIFVVFL